jgi:hypothetical protein
MQRQRIVEPVWFFRTDGDLLYLEPDPKQSLQHERFAIQLQKRVQTAISLHVITG